MSLTQILTHHCISRLSMTFLHSMITWWSAVMFCNFSSLLRFFQSKQYYNSGGKNINCESKLKVNESSQVSRVSQGPRFSQCHKVWPNREPKINSSRIEWSDLIKTSQVENMLLCYSPRHLTPFPECQPQEFRHDNSLDSIFTANKSDISEVSSRSLWQAKVDKLQKFLSPGYRERDRFRHGIVKSQMSKIAINVTWKPAEFTIHLRCLLLSLIVW